MKTQPNKPQLTPVGRHVLDAICRGRVTYLPAAQIVIQRVAAGEANDVSPQFIDLMRARFAYIHPYDLDFPPPEVACAQTSAGEDALMEAAQAERKRQKERGRR